MSDTPDIHLSVVIPTLERFETVRLLANRMRHLMRELAVEVIVVSPRNGGFGEGTPDFRFLADAGQGVYAAYNQGLRAARGKYVWFMGDDDYPLDAASALAEHLRQGEADLIIAPVIFSTGVVYKPKRTRIPLLFKNWCQQGVVYRRTLIERRRFFRRMRTQADHYVNIKLRFDPALRIRFLEHPVCVFGAHGLSSRVTTDHEFRALRMKLAGRYLRLSEFLLFIVLLHAQPVYSAIKKGLGLRRHAGASVPR